MSNRLIELGQIFRNTFEIFTIAADGKVVSNLALDKVLEVKHHKEWDELIAKEKD